MLTRTPIYYAATHHNETIGTAVGNLERGVIDGDIVRRDDTENVGGSADVSLDELGSGIDTTETLTEGNEKCPAEFA